MARPIGFWVRGGKHQERELVDARRAMAGFAACDPAAAPDGEHYLSVFTFGPEFSRHVCETGSTREYQGPCGADWIWFDIDRADDIDTALAETRALCLYITEEWGVHDEDMLVFLSGGKGFHVGIPTSLWRPDPSLRFNLAARRMAEKMAAKAGGCGIRIDTGVYDKVRIFRAPNSRHPSTGLRKRLLAPKELMELGMEGIVALARSPVLFELPAPTVTNPTLAQAWSESVAEIEAEQEAMRSRRASGDGEGKKSLNALTMDFIRNGAPEGGDGTAPEAGRHNRLFAAACDLAEFGCAPALAHALLTESALDCGLKPSDVRRTIDNALTRVSRQEQRNV